VTDLVKAHELYEVDYAAGTVKPKNKKCSRCGRMMAKHMKPSQRWACGFCGFTEFIKS
jgi:small subunit ribosomal protein S27Ae